jgi:hypothetical protein
MRQPTVGRSSRRTRQQRLLRTGIGVVVIVVLAALIANLVGNKKKGGLSEPGVAQVSFHATIKGENDAPTKPSTGATRTEADKIVTMLNEWYQRSFVDPKLYGDGTFPEITQNFTADAKAAFAKDVATLTIGDARQEVDRVEPSTETALVTVFFDKRAPKFAVAKVHFVATATLKQSGSYPLKIDQTVTFNFQSSPKGWVVTYYTANQTQKSVVPASPSPSASSS